MKNVIAAINKVASTTLECKAVSVDDDNIIRPSIVTDLSNITEDMVSPFNKTRNVNLSVVYFPKEQKTKEVDLIDAILALSKAFDKPIDCGDFKLDVIHREYRITDNREVIFDLQLTYDVDIEQEEYEDMDNLNLEV